MEAMEENSGNDVVKESTSDHLPVLDFSMESYMYEQPSVSPRIGDEYQVELPPVKTEIELRQTSTYADLAVEDDFSIGAGLDIPVFWVSDRVNGLKEEKIMPADNRNISEKSELESLENNRKIQVSLKNIDKPCLAEDSTCQLPNLAVATSEPEAEPLCETSDNSEECTGLKASGISLSNFQKSNRSSDARGRNLCSSIAMPGSQNSSWTSAEKESFLLGVYVFGKNFVTVRKFIESKDLGDILSFYYGEFYKSSAYSRWSECRKSKNKRCILKQRIFTGWRQQKLLSRLLPNLSAEGQSSLLKITKIFNEDVTSLEDYVFTLRDTVGMKALAEAIGIGKGKQDLTGIAVDHVRGNVAPSMHSEIPAGKACSSLTSGEIIKFLTGNFRLSKARSSDLFWEAVWPRLLEKGWHSEQPNDMSGATSKHNLVFLIPGIKRFSRSKLVKGKHYFDSVTDVLGKVASDPMLLVLEVDGYKEIRDVKEVDDWGTDRNQNSLENHHQPCYMRTKLVDCASDVMKFTVVDTSLVRGEAGSKVRELRSLPVGTTCDYVAVSSSDEARNSLSPEQQESGDASPTSQKKSYMHRGKTKDAKCKVNQQMPSENAVGDRLLSKKNRIKREDTNGHYLNSFHEQPLGDLKRLFAVDQHTPPDNTVPDHPIPKKKRIKKENANGHYPNYHKEQSLEDGRCLFTVGLQAPYGNIDSDLRYLKKKKKKKKIKREFYGNHRNSFTEHELEDSKCQFLVDQQLPAEDTLPIVKKKRIKREDPNEHYTNSLNGQKLEDLACQFKVELQMPSESSALPIPQEKRIHRQDMNGCHSSVVKEQSYKHIKCHSGQGGKFVESNHLASSSKRRRLNACDYSEYSDRDHLLPRGDHHLKREKSFQPKSGEAVGMVVAEVGSVCHSGKGSSPGKIFTNSPVKGSPSEAGQSNFITKNAVLTTVASNASFDEKSQQRCLIDLNVTPQLPDIDGNLQLSAEMTERHVPQTSSIETRQLPTESDGILEHKASDDAKEHHGMNERRQGTRSRPPTARALEALASGLLNPSPRGKSTKAPFSRSSRRARKKAEVSKPHTDASNCNHSFEPTSSMPDKPVDEDQPSHSNDRNLSNATSLEQENYQPACHSLPAT